MPFCEIPVEYVWTHCIAGGVIVYRWPLAVGVVVRIEALRGLVKPLREKGQSPHGRIDDGNGFYPKRRPSIRTLRYLCVYACMRAGVCGSYVGSNEAYEDELRPSQESGIKAGKGS